MKAIPLSFLICSAWFVTGCGEKDNTPGKQAAAHTVGSTAEKQQIEQELTSAGAKQAELKGEIQERKEALADLMKSLSELEHGKRPKPIPGLWVMRNLG
jgi:uncharacterized protein YlxW (UPF0749 family)